LTQDDIDKITRGTMATEMNLNQDVVLFLALSVFYSVSYCPAYNNLSVTKTAEPTEPVEPVEAVEQV